MNVNSTCPNCCGKSAGKIASDYAEHTTRIELLERMLAYEKERFEELNQYNRALIQRLIELERRQ